MNNMIYILLDISSPLYVCGLSFLNLLERHGFCITDQYSFPDRLRGFIYHMLNGMCAYGDGIACQVADGLSALDISSRMFSILFGALLPNDMLSAVCQSLGCFLDFEHQSRTPFDILSDYKTKSENFEPWTAVECLLRIPLLSFSDLLLLSARHGLTAMGCSDQLRFQVSQHISHGRCCLNRVPVYPIGCSIVQSQVFFEDDVHDFPHFHAVILREAGKILHRKELHLILNCHNISYDSYWLLPRLRSHVSSFVLDLLKKKNMSSKEHQDKWPEILCKEVNQNLIYAFKKETSSAKLKQLVCVCCGENAFHDDCDNIFVDDIDLDLFRRQPDSIPMTSPFSHGILKDLMLHPHGITVHPNPQIKYVLTICHPCCCSLRRH